MLLSIVAAVVIFAILVVVHETGHFLAAKRLGVRVLRFSIGYPPRIFGVRRGETDYALGATPLGGYVRMLGDEIAEEPGSDAIKSYLWEIALDLVCAAKSTGWLKFRPPTFSNPAHPNRNFEERAVGAIAQATAEPDVANTAAGRRAQVQPRAQQTPAAVLGRELTVVEMRILEEVRDSGSLASAIDSLAASRPRVIVDAFKARAFPTQRLAKRFAIVLAGPVANILFAPLLMIVVFTIGVPTLLPVIGKVRPDMPAFAAGIRQGDRVSAVDAKPIKSWDELSDSVKTSGGAPLQLKVTRSGERIPVHLTVVPKQLPEETLYGNKVPTWVIGVSPRGDKVTLSYGPLAAIRAGTAQTAQLLATLCVGIAKIFEGATPVREALGGPIMIAQMAGKEAHQGFADAALFTIMLSLELGIINLLPVPLLDGGHLLFFAIEGIRGKPMQLRHREIAMQVGLFLLVVLMAFVILNDISRIVG
ncbi:MAG: RIP metalloprotease RseP [Deltaproteobacteria bacterium]|nr:RIP metalloprotease RseP [Deltaproteobacteria bacterium]